MSVAVLAGASLAAAAIGTGVSTYGSIEQGQASARMANYQAAVAQVNNQIAKQNAQQATAAGNTQVENQEMQTAGLVATETADEAASGLDVGSGSPSKVQQSQNIMGTMDALTIQNNAAREAYGYTAQGVGYQAQAGLEGMAAQQAGTAGMLGAGSSILSGASSLTGNWARFQQAGVFQGGNTGNILASGGLY